MPRPLRVYLDQLHLQPKQDDLRQRLQRLARRNVLRAPISLTHFLETLKDNPTRCAYVRQQLLELSCGEVLSWELNATRHEIDAMRQGAGHDFVRRRVVSRDVTDWVRPTAMPRRFAIFLRALRCTPESLFELLSRLPDIRAINELARAELSHGADAANTARDSLPSFQETLLRLGVHDIGEMNDSELALRFRALATRRALQQEIFRARPSGVTPNDLTDLVFLSVALPYSDAVCVDRTMFARIEAARAMVGIPWAPAFKKLEDLVDWVETSNS